MCSTSEAPRYDNCFIANTAVVLAITATTAPERRGWGRALLLLGVPLGAKIEVSVFYRRGSNHSANILTCSIFLRDESQYFNKAVQALGCICVWVRHFGTTGHRVRSVPCAPLNHFFAAQHGVMYLLYFFNRTPPCSRTLYSSVQQCCVRTR